MPLIAAGDEARLELMNPMNPSVSRTVQQLVVRWNPPTPGRHRPGGRCAGQLEQVAARRPHRGGDIGDIRRRQDVAVARAIRRMWVRRRRRTRCG
jgi:hypothetical protein